MRAATKTGVLLVLLATGIGLILCRGRLPSPPLLSIGGAPRFEPDFSTQTGQKLEGKDKTVLVMCYAPTELKWDNDKVDYELAKHVAHRLNLNKIKVIDPDRVHAWLDKNKDWHKTVEVGAEFKVDYIVHVDLKEYSLFEEHSSDLYRGRADVVVSVYKMDDDKSDGNLIYSKDLISRFPSNTPVDAYSCSYDNFKKAYQSKLSREIGMLFYEHFE